MGPLFRNVYFELAKPASHEPTCNIHRDSGLLSSISCCIAVRSKDQLPLWTDWTRFSNRLSLNTKCHCVSRCGCIRYCNNLPLKRLRNSQKKCGYILGFWGDRAPCLKPVCDMRVHQLRTWVSEATFVKPCIDVRPLEATPSRYVSTPCLQEY